MGGYRVRVAPPDLPDPIPGWYLEALLWETGKAQIDLARALRHHDGVTVHKWVRGKGERSKGPQGMTTVQWYACLCALGKRRSWRPSPAAVARFAPLDLPKDWRPPGERRKR